MPKKEQTAHISELKLDPKNARKRTERSSYQIRASLEKFGGMRSIVIDEQNTVRAGNGTVEEAGQVGIEKVRIIDAAGDEIIAVRRHGLTEEQWKTYAIADNRTAELSEWDAEVLAELQEDVDLSQFWRDDELADLLSSLNEDSPQVTEEEDEQNTSDLIEKAESGEIESRVKPGQIWALGRHRIACGDSTDEKNVRALLGDNFGRVGMVWADPPYGINAVSKDGKTGTGRPTPFGGAKNRKNGVKQVAATIYSPIIGDNGIETAFNSARLALSLFLNAAHIWWGANHYLTAFRESSCWIVWDKQTDGNNFADAELAWCSSNTAVRIFRHLWQGMLRASEQGKRLHPTQKPIALCEWAFEKYGKPDDLIFDPFLGSAPSIIAAQKMEGTRTVYGFELSPEYCEVICRRFEALTGKNAELVGSL